MAHLGGGNKGYFIPGIILFYAMEYKLIYSTELRLKTLQSDLDITNNFGSLIDNSRYR
jgi:hypothetical protein